MDLKEFKKIALKNKKFKNEYEKYDIAFEIGQMIIEARILKGITQNQLASLVKTKQPSIARLENGQKLPSLRFLSKIAKALKTHLIAPKFAIFETKLSTYQQFIPASCEYSTTTPTTFNAYNTKKSQY